MKITKELLDIIKEIKKHHGWTQKKNIFFYSEIIDKIIFLHKCTFGKVKEVFANCSNNTYPVW